MAVAAFGDGEFDCEVCGLDAFWWVEACTLAEKLELGLIDGLVGCSDVGFWDLGTWVGYAAGELAVVGEDEQTLGGVVEAADGEKA